MDNESSSDGGNSERRMLEKQKKCRLWIEAVLKERLSSRDLHTGLKNGDSLCKLMEKIKPGSIGKFSENPSLSYVALENISKFLDAIRTLNVPESFTPSDLYQNKNIQRVVNCIFSLANVAKSLKFKPTMEEVIANAKIESKRSVKLPPPKLIDDKNVSEKELELAKKKKQRVSHRISKSITALQIENEAKSSKRVKKGGSGRSVKSSSSSPRKSPRSSKDKRKVPSSPARKQRKKPNQITLNPTKPNQAARNGLSSSNKAYEAPDVDSEDEYVYDDEVIEELKTQKVSMPSDWKATRAKAIKKLIDGEVVYQKKLDDINEIYVQPLWKHSVLKKQDLAYIFSNFEILCSLNSEIVGDLKKQASTSNQLMGRCFVDRVDSLKFYVQYAKNYEKALQTLESIKKNHAFNAFIETAKKKKELENQSLEDILLEPIDHLTKYAESLLNVYDFTPDNHEDLDDLDRAFDALDDICYNVDQIMMKSHNTKEMLKLISCLDAIPPLDDGKPLWYDESTRVIVRRGDMIKISKGRAQERHFVLFNDLLLYGKSKPGLPFTKKRYEVKDILDLGKILLNDSGTVDNFPYTFELVRLDDKKKKYIICCPTEGLKKAWMDDISYLITQHLDFARNSNEKGVAKKQTNLAKKKSAIKKSPSFSNLNSVNKESKNKKSLIDENRALQEEIDNLKQKLAKKK